MSTTCEFINVAQHMANTSEIISTRKLRKLIIRIFFFAVFYFYSQLRVYVLVRVLKKKTKNIRPADSKEKWIVEGHYEWPQMFYLFWKSKWVGSGRWKEEKR